MDTLEAIRHLRVLLRGNRQLFEQNPGWGAGSCKALCGTLTTGSRGNGTQEPHSVEAMAKDVGAVGKQAGLDPTPLVRLAVIPLPINQELQAIQDGLRWLDELELRLDVAELTPPTPTPGAVKPEPGTATNVTRDKDKSEGDGGELDDSDATPGTSTATDDETTGDATTTDEHLCERARVILQTLLENDAVDSDHRMTQPACVFQALGKLTDPNSCKALFSQLKQDGFLDSRTGRGGGMWLTDKGKKRADKL